MLLSFVSAASYASYQRNQAVPVEKVEFGKVDSVTVVTHQELLEAQSNGWQRFGGVVLGGVIGNQFGKGRGNTVATVLGALLGGQISKGDGGVTYKNVSLIQLLIKKEDGTSIVVLQDPDPYMQFQKDDKVRVIYMQGYVRVDLAY